MVCVLPAALQPPMPLFESPQQSHRNRHQQCHLNKHALLPSPPQVWAVRENLVELALGIPVLRLSRKAFYGLTALLVAAAYGISILVPSIYVRPTVLGLLPGTARMSLVLSRFFTALWPPCMLHALSPAALPQCGPACPATPLVLPSRAGPAGACRLHRLCDLFLLLPGSPGECMPCCLYTTSLAAGNA